MQVDTAAPPPVHEVVGEVLHPHDNHTALEEAIAKYCAYTLREGRCGKLPPQNIKMDRLPQDIVDIIYDYKHGAEHYDTFKQVCHQIVYHYWMTRKIILNSQFRNIFFPDFFSTLWLEPMTPDNDEEPDP